MRRKESGGEKDEGRRGIHRRWREKREVVEVMKREVTEVVKKKEVVEVMKKEVTEVVEVMKREVTEVVVVMKKEVVVVMKKEATGAAEKGMRSGTLAGATAGVVAEEARMMTGWAEKAARQAEKRPRKAVEKQKPPKLPRLLQQPAA